MVEEPKTGPIIDPADEVWESNENVNINEK
jgi:hypothetical protein